MHDVWPKVRLGDIFEPTNHRLGEHVDEPEIFSVTKYDGFVPAEEYFGKRIASAKLDTYKIVEADGWAYSTIHINEGSIARNRLGRRGVVSPMYTTMRLATDQIEPYYAELVMRSPWMLARYGDAQQGSINRRRSLPWKTFASLTLPLPTKEEQRRIVDLIDAVDETISAAQSSANALEDLWWASTRELESECSEEPTRLLGEISDIHGGLTKNKKDAERPDAVEAPYLRVANVLRRRLILDEVTTIVAAKSRVEAAQLHPGDILMNEGGDRDKLGRGAVWRGEIVGCTHQNHVFRVRITEPHFVPEFVSAWANSFGQKWFDVHGSQTTGIASISKTTLSRFPVPALPRELQEQWAVLLDSVTERQWQTEELTEHLRSVRSNLLSALLSGAHEIPESYDAMMSELTPTLV